MRNQHDARQATHRSIAFPAFEYSPAKDLDLDPVQNDQASVAKREEGGDVSRAPEEESRSSPAGEVAVEEGQISDS